MDKDNLIQKWLSDELTVEERKAFEAMEDAAFYEDIVKNAGMFKASNFSTVADFETFKNRAVKPDTPVRKLHWLKPALRIASILVVSFGLYYFLTLNKSIEIQTLAAEKTTIELPDASTVELNALSQISYNKKEWDKKREIQLEGEAFFDVAKGAKFDVVTSQGTVSVLGTEFNVKQRGTYFEVACFEGTVRVVAGKDVKILKVGDNFTSINGEVVSGKNTFESPQWTKNISYFQRIPVSEVIAELERQYNIKVTVENIDADLLFTGGFAHGNLENALLAISEPLGLNYEILKPNKVRFSKREK
ncbi:DUF4974 domain-containing protein [Flavobacteriaceae bacterium TP-CH-4]|uniref:DUF4974 domain-containing protein n=1 Tax=Pelagihabitans pacificus TaxID=2696054 RepID=A0A967AZR6_9FLAO|nr:FecR domain-containing protein [Pelagihabitans pacificus]NHF60522.1 DUF4974 domain-containing protein [Pelagihabitans pacificus]